MLIYKATAKVICRIIPSDIDLDYMTSSQDLSFQLGHTTKAINYIAGSRYALGKIIMEQ